MARELHRRGGERFEDAIHLATAEGLGNELSALVTYDDRMVNAAKQLGYPIVQPR